jgi:hypothetical protein
MRSTGSTNRNSKSRGESIVNKAVMITLFCAALAVAELTHAIVASFDSRPLIHKRSLFDKAFDATLGPVLNSVKGGVTAPGVVSEPPWPEPPFERYTRCPELPLAPVTGPLLLLTLLYGTAYALDWLSRPKKSR